MSQENVEIVREVMALLANVSADADNEASERLLQLIAPDVHIDMSRRVFNPGTYDGHDGLRRLGREMEAVWADFTTTPGRLVDVGDRVAVIETRRGRGRGSGVEVEQRAGVIWTLRDGQIIRMETDLDPNDALKAVGLDE